MGDHGEKARFRPIGGFRLVARICQGEVTDLHMSRRAEVGLDPGAPPPAEQLERLLDDLLLAARADAQEAIAAAARAFPDWSSRTAYERSELLYKAWQILTDRSDELARILTMEQGKPFVEAKGETLLAGDVIDGKASSVAEIEAALARHGMSLDVVASQYFWRIEGKEPGVQVTIGKVR